MNKRKLINIILAIIILVLGFMYMIIQYKYIFIDNKPLKHLQSIIIIYIIIYIFIRIIDKPVKSVNIMKLISIILGFGLIGFGLTQIVIRDKHITNKGNILNPFKKFYRSAIGMDKMENDFEKDWKNTKDKVYAIKMRSLIDPNIMLTVKFARGAIPWPYTVDKYLIHVEDGVEFSLNDPIYVLPKDLNSGIYPWNFGNPEEEGLSGNSFVIRRIKSKADINDSDFRAEAFYFYRDVGFLTEKNNIKVYKELPITDIRGKRYIIPTNFPNQKHPLMIQYEYKGNFDVPKLWGYWMLNEFKIITLLSPGFVVEHTVFANRLAEVQEEVKKIKLDFDKGITWNELISLQALYGGSEAINNLYNLIINTRDVIEIKDRKKNKPDRYTEISRDHPELLVNHPEIFAKIVEYNEKFIAYLKTIATETKDGKKFKYDIIPYEVIEDPNIDGDVIEYPD